MDSILLAPLSHLMIHPINNNSHSIWVSSVNYFRQHKSGQMGFNQDFKKEWRHELVWTTKIIVTFIPFQLRMKPIKLQVKYHPNGRLRTTLWKNRMRSPLWDELIPTRLPFLGRPTPSNPPVGTWEIKNGKLENYGIFRSYAGSVLTESVNLEIILLKLFRFWKCGHSFQGWWSAGQGMMAADCRWKAHSGKSVLKWASIKNRELN